MVTADSHGDVTGEYLALRRDCGLVRSGRELVWVGGPDSISFLQGLITADLEPMAPGTVGRSLLLAPAGRLRALLWVLRGEDEVGLAADAGCGEVVAGDLERFRIRVDVEVGPPAEVVEIIGPASRSVLERAGLAAADGWTRDGGVVVAQAPLSALPRFLVSEAAGDRLLAAGARPVGRLAATAVRVEAGEPIMGRDLDERAIPQEAGLMEEAVSLEKGCFLGYELVERIHSRGRVVRSLRGVRMATNLLPPDGSTVLDDQGKEVGSITSVAESLTLRAPVALGVVRTDLPSGAAVEVRWSEGGAAATLLDLPMDDFADMVAADPRTPE